MGQPAPAVLAVPFPLPRCAFGILGVILLMAAISYWMLQRIIIVSQGGESLLEKAIGSDWKGKMSPLIYFLAIPSAFWSHSISQAIYVSIALIRLVPDRRIAKVLTDKRD
ncbi:MAG: hypothetical protein ACP5SH_16395 [Syntrophobacteraceae bacterium]